MLHCPGFSDGAAVMDSVHLTRLLRNVQRGSLRVSQALEQLKLLPYENLGFARIDNHRELRQGFPEVIFCEGKTVDQIHTIIRRSLSHARVLLATRATPEIYDAVGPLAPHVEYNPVARTIVLRTGRPPRPRGRVLIVTAGTSDIPVAEEAAVTAGTLGSRVEALYDVGVAGIHRLLGSTALLTRARVVVAVAGMDGVLPSVVGGMVDKPVIAVPTSVGYGASLGGLTALFTMLNSCAAGVAVVNIDNGFGAGVLAHRINTLAAR